jgi:hypothetical protein
MSRVTSVLAVAAVTAILTSGIAVGQQSPPTTTRDAPAPRVAPSSAPAKDATGKVQAKSKSAPDRATSKQRQFECLKQARARRLHFARRRAFMKACLAGGK